MGQHIRQTGAVTINSLVELGNVLRVGLGAGINQPRERKSPGKFLLEIFGDLVEAEDRHLAAMIDGDAGEVGPNAQEYVRRIARNGRLAFGLRRYLVEISRDEGFKSLDGVSRAFRLECLDVLRDVFPLGQQVGSSALGAQ